MSSPAETPVRLITPKTGHSLSELRDLDRYRDLIYFLIRRDVAVRYKQSAVGGLWAVLQPVLLAGVFSVFFGILAKVPSEAGIPYPLFAVSGMVMWLFFASAVTNASQSTVSSAELISKVYFPRIVIPIAAVVPPVVDFAAGLVVVLAVMFAYGFVPGVQIVLVPVVTVLTLLTALGIGLWFSALNVKYRDIGVLIPFLVLVGLFVTPIVYPFELVPTGLQPLYALNPMVGVMEAYRWMLFPDSGWPGLLLLIPVGVSAILLVTGVMYFQRAESSFADVI